MAHFTREGFGGMERRAVLVSRSQGWLIGIFAYGELQRLLWLRDLGHGGLRDEAAALQLPFLLLLQ